MKKKILLFGPFADFGGRELEGSFIASVLSSKYDIDVCSSSSITNRSQLFEFNKNQKVFSLYNLLCSKYFSIKIFSILSYLKNRFKGVYSNYANNIVAKRYFNYNQKINNILEELILQYDLVFICAQFSSNYMSNIISFSKKKNTKIIFRTTGTIKDVNFNYLKDIELFIHHSLYNASKLQMNNYDIIDQCSFIEDKLLSLQYNDNNTNFLLLGRISEGKGFEEAIAFFIKCKKTNDRLIVVGEGELKEKLEKKYAGFSEINFYGFIKSDMLGSVFEEVDCLIIPSLEESGPLVGVEAMAAGKLIISTKVGAMPERLKNTLNDFWFDIHDFSSFEKEFNRFKLLDNVMRNKISQSLRNEYKETRSIAAISKKYLDATYKVLGS